jgi:IS5 family transposase
VTNQVTTASGSHPSPVDRGKPRSKIHVLSDRAGLPLSLALSAANTSDAFALQPLVRAIPAIRSRRGPRCRKPVKLHADKSYDQADLRAWLRDRSTAVRIAPKASRPVTSSAGTGGSSNERSPG